mmetsp:Transcript_3133/g.11727  ORF Transcript_3133/g.11727 Transcript_3133/m.11727 type:complete len:218 (-) Transcript_3133:542-1195(-)
MSRHSSTTRLLFASRCITRVATLMQPSCTRRCAPTPSVSRVSAAIASVWRLSWLGRESPGGGFSAHSLSTVTARLRALYRSAALYGPLCSGRRCFAALANSGSDGRCDCRTDGRIDLGDVDALGDVGPLSRSGPGVCACVTTVSRSASPSWRAADPTMNCGSGLNRGTACLCAADPSLNRSSPGSVDVLRTFLPSSHSSASSVSWTRTASTASSESA